MVSLLVEDATFAMPPFPCWFAGREDVVSFISQFTPTLRHVVTSAGGQPGIAWYILDRERGVYLPAAIEVLALEGDRVCEITAFASPELFPRFGLADELV
jgi:RNA polymerase sigma-70 factor (ECF subfamily)